MSPMPSRGIGWTSARHESESVAEGPCGQVGTQLTLPLCMAMEVKGQLLIMMQSARVPPGRFQAFSKTVVLHVEPMEGGKSFLSI